MKLYFVLLLTIFQVSTYAQERYVPLFAIDKKQLIVEQQIGKGNSGWYSTPRFNDLFDNIYPLFYLPQTDFYQQKKVKQVWVQDYRKDTVYSIALNNKGQVSETYSTVGDLAITERFYYDEDGEQSLHTKRYKRMGIEVRLDSLVNTKSIYIESDTLYTFSTSIEKVYKTGAWLNDQNTYYNHEYLNKRRLFNTFSNINLYPNQAAERSVDGIIYLKDTLRTDYANGFHLCTVRSIAAPPTQAGRFITSGRDKRKFQKEAVAKPQYNKDVKTYHADGESFVEPSEMRTTFRCGFSNFDGSYRGNEYGYIANEQGLYESYVSKADNPYHVIYTFAYSFFE